MPLELEHAIGFNGSTSNGLHVHPFDETIIYVLGGCVVIAQVVVQVVQVEVVDFVEVDVEVAYELRNKHRS